MWQGGLILGAGRVRSNFEVVTDETNPVAPETHSTHRHQNHGRPRAATTSRRPASKKITRASLNSPASVGARRVEIGHLQLSQSSMYKDDAVAHRQYTERRTA